MLPAARPLRNENELLNDYTIKDADAGFDDPSVLDDNNSGDASSRFSTKWTLTNKP